MRSIEENKPHRNSVVVVVCRGHGFIKSGSKFKAKNQEKTTIFVCDTIKGKDIPFAENQPIWAYKTLDQDHYDKAIDYLNNK